MAKEKKENPAPQAGEEKKAKAVQPKAKGAKQEAAKAETVVEEKVTARLSETYKKEIIPALMKRFGYKNVMQVPRLEKISINCGVGEATQDQKILETVVRELTVISGQKPAITKSKKAISNFKLET